MLLYFIYHYNTCGTGQPSLPTKHGLYDLGVGHHIIDILSYRQLGFDVQFKAAHLHSPIQLFF